MARSVAGASSMGSTSTQVAVPVPATPAPMRPVQAAHDHRELAVGQLAGVLDLGHGADGGVAAVDLGDQQEVAAGVAGGAGAERDSGVSRVAVTTMPGSTTPLVRGRSGRVSIRKLRHSFSRSRGCDTLINSGCRPAFLEHISKTH